MLFDLQVIKDCKNQIWTYETDGSYVRDENGTLLNDFNVKSNIIKIVPFSEKENSHKYKTNLDVLEILLGYKCNYNCKYCSQKSIRTDSADFTPKHVDQFIEKLKKSNITTKSIQLWGGEPLVYWKTIKVLVPKLRELYPKCILNFVTNGSLLTKEIIDFCKETHMSFSISHDGEDNTDRTTDDILDDEEIIETIKYAINTLPEGRISIKPTITNKNADIKSLIKFFERKIDPRIIVLCNNVVVTHNAKDLNCRMMCSINESNKKMVSESIFEILNNVSPKDKAFCGLRDNVINSMVHHATLDNIVGECSQGVGDSLTVDVNGNILKCHTFGVNTVCGSIDDLENAKIIGHTHFTNRLTDCKNCPVVHSCKGGCTGLDNNAHKLSCPNYYAMHYGYFKSAIATLFGAYLLDIKQHENR